MEKIIDAICKDLEWTRDEAKNFLRAFRADTREQLQDDINRAIKWASDIRHEAALIGIIKSGIVKAKYVNGELSVALNVPEADGQPDEAQEWRDYDPDC